MKRSSRGWGLGTGGLLIALIAVLVAAPVAAQTPALDAVLAKAGAYVVEFQRQLSGVVAEEKYVQNVRYPLTSSATSNPFRITHRELTSDLLMVKPIGGDRWLQFRDVFNVDGKPVRDRNERLMQLFLAPSSSSAAQTQRIIDEGARYNIGNLQRTVNTPVFALLVLDPANQRRFRFKITDRAEPMLGRSAAVQSAALVVEFQEVEKQTMIRTTNSRDLPARGRFWIDPDTGRVLGSELVAEDPSIRGIIDVAYELEPTSGLLAPESMRERYDITRDHSRVDGEATYTKFRQFQVKVDEKLAPVVKQ
jgi:hypothetical protein